MVWCTTVQAMSALSALSASIDTRDRTICSGMLLNLHEESESRSLTQRLTFDRHVRVHHVDKDRDDDILRDVLNQRTEGQGKTRRRRTNTGLMVAAV
jgi:hypothetical protein